MISRSPVTCTTRTSRDDCTAGGPTSYLNPSTEPGEADLIYDAQRAFDRYGQYTPVGIVPGLAIELKISSSFHANLLGSQLNLPGLIHELYYENDVALREYLSFGVQNGFYILDPDVQITPYHRANYSSVLKGEPFKFIDSLIKSELAAKKYVLTDTKPICVQSLGAVSKKSGGWRPITDCKRPIGTSINSFMTTTYKEFCYSTVDNVIDLIQPGWYMASVDISAAYRSILIHLSQWKYQGVSWEI